VSEQIENYTKQAFKSSRDGEISRLSQLDAQLTNALRKLAIGSSEARHLFGHRERVRQELATISEGLLPSHREVAAMAVERFAGVAQ
jgi:hypothetical protein